MVETAAGEWWGTFLAVRPYEGDFYNTGRETFLLPVHWENGWPRMTAPGDFIPYTHKKPLLPSQRPPAIQTSGAFTIRDEFDGPKLPPYWLMMRNPREPWYELTSGSLRMRARAVGLGDFGNPSFVGRRQQHLNASASTMVRFLPASPGDEAGLVAIQNDEYWYSLAISGGSQGPIVKLERRAGGTDPAGGVLIASRPLDVSAGTPVYLRIEARGGAYDFAYATQPGRWRTLRSGEDGKILSTKTAGGFVGALFGLHAYASSPSSKD
jgi:alpha-N-arabinofuranosidase